MDPLNVIQSYRSLRALCNHHQTAAMSYVADGTLMNHARMIGVAIEDEVLVGEEDPEMKLVHDLALYTAKRGRSRAIDRYARAVRCEGGSDDARVLDALRNSRFGLFQIERRHEVAGVVLTDMVREHEVWLMDEDIPYHGEHGQCFGARVCWPDEFAIVCQVVVPMDQETFEDTLLELGSKRWRDDVPRMVEDATFATSLYRVAVDSGMMSLIADDDDE